MYTTKSSQPTAEITFRKSRLKKYQDNKIYLKNDQEFEIELFNPTTGDILAKISIDGNELSGGGIVLRPGERVFLDRYLDKPQKFKFSTYEVGKSNAVENAIRNNGRVKVAFHKETIYSPNIFNSSPSWTYNSPTVYGGSFGVPATNIFNCSSGTTNGNFGYSTLTSYNANIGASACMDSLNFMDQEKSIDSNKKETGKIEAGSKSDQNLVHVDKNFDYSSFAISEYQILPESQKTYTSADIKAYCSKCGKKAKKGDNFCSSCGNKI